jgi:hypothetical protein
MNDKVAEWNTFFDQTFEFAKRTILEWYRLGRDGSGPPETLAIRKATILLPCPVRIAELKIDKEKHGHIRDELCQVIRYDFSRLGTKADVDYCGVVDTCDKERLKELLVKRFDLNEGVFDDFYRDFRTIGWCDDETTFSVQSPLYDVRSNFRKFANDFALLFLESYLAEKIRQASGQAVDWSSKFNLPPDPILPMSDIAKMDETLAAFLPFPESAGIEQLQKDICGIQLIPSVPGDVKEIFQHAKKLHIYGFFHYIFFTISQHYAYLALESAIKNRYYLSFGDVNVLANKKGETVRIGRIDHQVVWDLCRRRRGWRMEELTVNGEKFAANTRGLLDWLVKNKIATEWERKLCAKGMNLRNVMSHLTHPLVFPPSYSVRALRFVADIINRLYLSCPPRTHVNSSMVFRVDYTP